MTAHWFFNNIYFRTLAMVCALVYSNIVHAVQVERNLADGWSLGGEFAFNDHSDDKNGFGLRLGFTFNDRWSIEGGYATLGKLSGVYEGQVEQAEDTTESFSQPYEFTPAGYYLSAQNYFKHFGKSRFYAKAGVMLWDHEVRTFDQQVLLERFAVNPLLGIGYEFAIKPNLDMVIEIRHINGVTEVGTNEQQTINSLNFGLVFNFATDKLTDFGDMGWAWTSGRSERTATDVAKWDRKMPRKAQMSDFTMLNQAPTVTPIKDVVWNGESEIKVSVEVGDELLAPEDILVIGHADNLDLIPPERIKVEINGNKRHITIRPVSGQFGEALVSVKASDGEALGTTDFKITYKDPFKDKNAKKYYIRLGRFVGANTVKEIETRLAKDGYGFGLENYDLDGRYISNVYNPKLGDDFYQTLYAGPFQTKKLAHFHLDRINRKLGVSGTVFSQKSHRAFVSRNVAKVKPRKKPKVKQAPEPALKEFFVEIGRFTDYLQVINLKKTYGLTRVKVVEERSKKSGLVYRTLYGPEPSIKQARAALVALQETLPNKLSIVEKKGKKYNGVN